MKTTIVFQPEDKQLPQLILECEYQFCEGEAETRDCPGSDDGVEVYGDLVRCVDVDCDGGPTINRDDILSKLIGGLAWECGEKRIEKACYESHCEESQGDPDRERE